MTISSSDTVLYGTWHHKSPELTGEARLLMRARAHPNLNARHRERLDAFSSIIRSSPMKITERIPSELYAPLLVDTLGGDIEHIAIDIPYSVALLNTIGALHGCIVTGTNPGLHVWRRAARLASNQVTLAESGYAVTRSNNDSLSFHAYLAQRIDNPALYVEFASAEEKASTMDTVVTRLTAIAETPQNRSHGIQELLHNFGLAPLIAALDDGRMSHPALDVDFGVLRRELPYGEGTVYRPKPKH